MAPRATSTASISFGLVTIPVRVYAATEISAGLHFNLLHARDGVRLRQQLVCPEDGEVVPHEDVVKGYEFEKDRYVVVDEADLQKIKLETSKELASDYFTQRREIGVINIGQEGVVEVEGVEYKLANRDALYIGRGNQQIFFGSCDTAVPARFYLVSYPAHKVCPTAQARKSEAEPARLGSQIQANARTIYKYIHPEGIKSCQLVMGFTELESGSVWNTMPVHTHERRSEIYLYFDLPGDALVVHCLGRPDETRQAVFEDQTPETRL